MALVLAAMMFMAVLGAMGFSGMGQELREGHRHGGQGQSAPIEDVMSGVGQEAAVPGDPIF